MAKKPPEPDFVVNAREPALGAGIVVKRSYDGTQTVKFASGERVFKDAYVKLYMKPAFGVSPELKAKLVPPPARPTAVAAKSRHPALEAEILAQPDEAGPYLVYADWLQQQEDPRGELIVAQHDRAGARETKLLSQHAAYFMPVMLDRALRVPKRSGQPRSTATWRFGFLDEVRLALPPTEKAQYLALEEVVADVLAHPSGAFLRRLVLGQGAGASYTYIAQLAAITRAKHAGLRELVVGDFDATDMELAQTRAGDLSPVLRATPALRSLRVKAGELRCMQPIAHAELRTLAIETVELATREVNALCDGALPQLETLELASDGLGLTRAQLVKLRAKTPVFPKLRHLALRGTLDTYSVIDALLASPLLPRLETLELDRCDLDDAGAARILDRAASFGHLRRFAISGTRLSVELQATLAKALGNTRLAPAVRFAISESDVVAEAPDRASLAAARKVAHAEKWLALGYDVGRDRLWGEYEGGDHYRVFVQFRGGRHEVGCECPSPKDPCKHAIALMLLAARQHAFPEREVPAAVMRHASRERPTYGWDL
jgi:uncharacterized protein (TIGR02996 family)